MAWHAKPSGSYSVNSTEWQDNVDQIYALLSSTWTLEAIAGMAGNMQAESGMNPWRWQSDSVSLTSSSKGYGLPQFTPAYGYIEDYGVNAPGYAPNLSTSSVTSGASAGDGRAQIYVIDNDLAGKFLNRQSYCSYWDISDCYPLSSYRQVSDLYTATVGWLFNYEFPADRSQSVANTRYGFASSVYEYISGHSPPDIDESGGSVSRKTGHRIMGIGLKRRKVGRRWQ